MTEEKLKLKRRTTTLKLSGDFEGGRVKVKKNCPIALILRILDMDSTSGKEQESLIREFGEKVLVSWNLQEEIKEDVFVDIPADGDGVFSLDDDVYFEVMRAWGDRFKGSRNLEQPPSEPDTSV